MPVNNHIRDYLDYYCGLDAPDYAVLLSGKWGSGKSHFISQFQETNSEQFQFIYVSLYGLQSTSQISDAFFEQLHPLLSSKGMGIASKLVKGAIKKGLSLDLDSLTQYGTERLSETKGHILIFDDLERCDMPMSQVLGYVNTFVEHDDRHVIILADESKVTDEAYANIKEKLIGQAFEIHVDIDNALSSFCSNVTNEKCHLFLLENKTFLRDVFIASKYDNLRALKKITQDFNRIFEMLSEEAQVKNDLLLNMLGVLMMISFEVRCSGLGVDYVKQLIERSWSAWAGVDDKEDDISTLQKKYRDFLLDVSVPNAALWQEYVKTGFFNAKDLDEAVLNSLYFQNENTPNWIYLWHGLDLEDVDFDEAHASVEESLRNNEYKRVPVIKHVFGLFLWMAKNGLYDQTEDEVVSYFHTYVEHLIEGGQLEFEESSYSSWDGSHAGLAYYSKEEDVFREFCSHLETELQKIKEAAYPEQAEKLLELMASDNRLFYRSVCLTNSEDNKYYQIPIFKYIKPERFVESMTHTSAKDRRRLGNMFKSRYEHHDINKLLVDELFWLKYIKHLLELKVRVRKGRVSGYVFQQIIDAGLKPAIINLKAVREAS